MASNVLAHAGPDGEYQDWIELYNVGDADVDLNGFYLTDRFADDKEPGDYASFRLGDGPVIEAGGFLVLYRSDLEFGIDKGGEEIVLLAPDGQTVVDKVTFGGQIRDVSFGRAPDGSGDWGYSYRHSAGAANAPVHGEIVRAPGVEPPDSFQAPGVEVAALPDHVADEIRYTMDGSDPTESSTLYDGPVRLDRDAVFRARAFRKGALASPVVSRTYLIVADHELPIVTLTVDPDSLYHPDRGIVAQNRSGRGWERHAEVVLFDRRELLFRIPAGLRLQGRTGPDEYEKKSFRLFFRGGYGASRLEYPLFPSDPVTTHSRLVLRSGRRQP